MHLHEPTHWKILLLFPMSSTDHFKPSTNHYQPRRTAYNRAIVLLACAKHVPINLFYSDSKNGTLEPSTLTIIFELLTKFSCRIPPIRLRKGCSKSHVREPYSSTDPHCCVYNRLMIENWMSGRHHTCLKLVNSNPAFLYLWRRFTRYTTTWGGGGTAIQLTKFNHLIQLFPFRTTRLGFEPVQCTYTLEVRKTFWMDVRRHPDKREKPTTQLVFHPGSRTSSAYSKSHSLLFERKRQFHYLHMT